MKNALMVWCAIAVPYAARAEEGAGEEAEPECTLNAEAIAGKLDHKAKGVAKSIPPTVEDRRMSEGVVFDDGVALTLNLGGCAHYGYELTYALVKSTRDLKDVRYYIKEALRLLARTPSKEPGFTKILIGALTDTAKAKKLTAQEDGSYALTCGDATCALAVTRTDPQHVSVKLSYDFAL